MTKNLLAYATLTFLLIFTIAPTVSAINYPPTNSSNLSTGNYDWQTPLKALDSTFAGLEGAVMTNFVGITGEGTTQPTTATWWTFVLWSPTPGALIFDTQLYNSGVDKSYTVRCTINCHYAQVFFPHGSTGGSVNSTGTASTYTIRTPLQTTPPYSNPSGGSVFTNVYTAKGVPFSDTWDATKSFATTFKNGTAKSCAPFDVACKTSELFAGVADTFVAVGRTILNGIYDFFIPDAQTITDQMNTFQDATNEQLGFLLFPITFVNDLFDSLTNTSGFCSSTDCSIDLTVYGQTGQIDLLQMKHSSFAPAWDYGVIFIRGLAVLAIISLAYRKYLEVLDR